MSDDGEDVMAWEQSLSEVLGIPAPEAPICLSEIWEDGIPLQDEDRRSCIHLLALLFRDRQITPEATKKALSVWSGNEILSESEVSRAYDSDERLTCKLMQDIKYVSDRCEKDFCEFPAWRTTHNIASLEKIKKQKIEKKFAKSEEQTGPTVVDAIKALASVCDHATSKDGAGFSKFDREENEDLIDKAVNDGYLDPKEEKSAYRFLKKYKKQLKGLGISFDEIGHIARGDSEEAPIGPAFSEDILAEANRILDEGKGFEYVYDVWQKRHHGDANLGKGLFLSIGSQSCLSSKGIHIHACGPRGSGKSDGAEKASESIPGDHLLVGSASPKALYYLGERLPAGSVVYLDDIGWNDQAAQMFKTCTTFYQGGATHTVVVDQEIRQFKTAPRIIFWLTTADDQTDEQIRDRLLRIDTTEDPKHTKAVIDFIFDQRKSGAAAFDSRELEICQAIIYLLKQVFVDVVIPFSDHIQFEGDPRGANIFADLVSSFAIWRHRIREHDDNGAIIACYEDYKDAETFFNAIRGHGDTKYTPSELRILQAIKDLHGEATREMIMEKTGLSKGGLADLLNGRSRDGQAKYGLLHKCPALTEEDESTSIQLDDATRTSRRKKICRLPANYDVLKAYGKIVYLSDETDIKQKYSAGSDEFGNGSQDKIESGKDIVRKFVVNDNIRESNPNEPNHTDESKSEKLSLSLQEPKNGELANLESADCGSPLRTNPDPTRSMPNQGESREEQRGIGPHPRRDEPTRRAAQNPDSPEKGVTNSRDCGNCRAAKEGDRSAITCDYCIYLAGARG